MGADLLGIGSIVNGALGLGKAIVGGFQAAKGNRQMNSLLNNRPQYSISQGYQDAYKTYQNMANSGLPGYDIMKGQIDQSGAKAMTNLERGAMGSNQLMSGALSSQDKELDAIKNLGLMSAQWKAQQQQNLAGAQNQMGQLQDQQWNYNVNEPWQIKTNMAANKMGTGQQNVFSGLGEAASALSNYAGTSALMKVYQSQQQNGGNYGANQQVSQPLANNNTPQSNLNNTLSNVFNQWQSNNG